MLVVTEAAAGLIGELTVRPELPESTGLRITSDAAGSDGPGWAATLSGGPGPEDRVIQVSRGRIYLDPAAADLLADKILDARRIEDGDVVFHVRRQRRG